MAGCRARAAEGVGWTLARMIALGRATAPAGDPLEIGALRRARRLGLPAEGRH